MKSIIETERIPIKVWATGVEEGALKQARNLANLSVTFDHIALMPDTHSGYGMPIGGVMATQDVIIPNAVGVDIGCGMCAVQTSLTGIDVPSMKKIMGLIRERVPVGFEHKREKSNNHVFDNAPDIAIIQQELNNARYQLGTLGGGNHFAEIQKGSDGFIWLMLHSGSRNFGLKIAQAYHDKAKALCIKEGFELTDMELAYLPKYSTEGIEYYAAMSYALDFAKENRKMMMIEIIGAVKETFMDVIFKDAIDVHHNYASPEWHFGKKVMVHRKGATQAGDGQLGLIPGSQGTKSYVVIGKGNKDSFESCSHGAGRQMGRGAARRELNLEAEQKRLDDQGIIHSVRNKEDLDEAAGAYKDIAVVMENQSDLVDIKVELSPLAVIKG